MPITQWPLWYARKTVPGLQTRKGYPLPAQSPAGVQQMAVGFGKPAGVPLSECLDIFEVIEVPNRPMMLEALRFQWSRRELMARLHGGSPVAA